MGIHLKKLIEGWFVDGASPVLGDFGNERYPVCMMVLSGLYMHWFDQEYKQRLEEATDMPTCGDYEDYLRKGIPFLTNHDRKITVVGEIELFPLSVYGRAEELCNDGHPSQPVEYDDRDIYMGGVVTVHAGFDEHRYYYCDFITGDGVKLPYDAWSGTQHCAESSLTHRCII